MSNKIRIFLWPSIFAFSLLLFQQVQARPEYAAQNNMANCTACHVNPTGGGLRTVYGKLYGLANKPVSQLAPTADIQADFRSLLFYQENSANRRNGLGLMSSILTGRVQPSWGEGRPKNQLVLSYDLGVFNPGVREAYVLVDLTSDEEELRQGLQRNLMVGRFQVPFGIKTDEHRTYVRAQSGTSFSEFQMGVLYSADASHEFHYDLGLINGKQAASTEGGGEFSQGETYGGVVNMRWSPYTSPLVLGTSGLYNKRKAGQNDLWAASLYSALPLNRVFNHYFDAILLAEYVVAEGWNERQLNSEMSRLFLGNQDALATEVARTRSQGWLAKFIWDFKPRWSFIYKYDSLTLSDDYPADTFFRHGAGIRYWPNNQMIFQLRAEVAHGGHPSVQENTPASQNAYWFLFHYYL